MGGGVIEVGQGFKQESIGTIEGGWVLVGCIEGWGGLKFYSLPHPTHFEMELSWGNNGRHMYMWICVVLLCAVSYVNVEEQRVDAWMHKCFIYMKCTWLCRYCVPSSLYLNTLCDASNSPNSAPCSGHVTLTTGWTLRDKCLDNSFCLSVAWPRPGLLITLN